MHEKKKKKTSVIYMSRFTAIFRELSGTAYAYRTGLKFGQGSAPGCLLSRQNERNGQRSEQMMTLAALLAARLVAPSACALSAGSSPNQELLLGPKAPPRDHNSQMQLAKALLFQERTKPACRDQPPRKWRRPQTKAHRPVHSKLREL